MCGVAGLRRFHSSVTHDDIDSVPAYVARLRHRGPDNQSVLTVDESTVLGSARLRITDAYNVHADMPLQSEDGSLVIVFNGEIYNHQTLRASLATYSFQTESDTETLLAAYKEWGPSCVDRLEGMFSFCIVDTVKQSLFLAVDPLGQKPLYYTMSEGCFRFASELSPLLEDPRYAYSWNSEAISELIAQRMIVGSDTHIREIQKLDAGCYLYLSSDGSGVPVRYFHLALQEDLVADGDAAIMLRSRFLESVGSMAPLEVPGAVFLSGGLDSSSVMAALVHMGAVLPTYTIGFEPIADRPTFSDAIVDNEFSYTTRLSQEYQTSNTRRLLSSLDFFHYWDAWTNLMDEPLCFNETAAHLALFEQAASSCKVVYGGAGADELFDGYGFGIDLAAREVPLSEIASNYYHSFNYSFGCNMELLLHDAGTASRTIAKLNSYVEPYASSTTSTVQGVQCLMAHARLPHSEFRQIDRASMHHSIEVRLPFANRSFLEAAFSFSPVLKTTQGLSKFVLRQAMEPLLPEYITTRPKVPFAPIGELFFTEACDQRLRELFSDDAVLPGLGVVDMDYVRTLYQSSDPSCRPVLVNLLLINRVLSRQAPYLSKEEFPWSGLQTSEKKHSVVSRAHSS